MGFIPSDFSGLRCVVLRYSVCVLLVDSLDCLVNLSHDFDGNFGSVCFVAFPKLSSLENDKLPGPSRSDRRPLRSR